METTKNKKTKKRKRKSNRGNRTNRNWGKMEDGSIKSHRCVKCRTVAGATEYVSTDRRRHLSAEGLLRFGSSLLLLRTLADPTDPTVPFPTRLHPPHFTDIVQKKKAKISRNIYRDNEIRNRKWGAPPLSCTSKVHLRVDCRRADLTPRAWEKEQVEHNRKEKKKYYIYICNNKKPFHLGKSGRSRTRETKIEGWSKVDLDEVSLFENKKK